MTQEQDKGSAQHELEALNPVHELEALVAEFHHGLPFDATSRDTLVRVISTLRDAAFRDAAPQPNAALADGWISVDERLPKCPSKPGSLGVEVLIHPPMPDGSITAFYGRRQSTKPAFYKYGVLAHGVEFWMTPPAPPTLNASKGDGNAEK